MSWALFPRATGQRRLWLATASLLAFAASPAVAQDAPEGQVVPPPAVPTLPDDSVPPGPPALQPPHVSPVPHDAPKVPPEAQVGFARGTHHYEPGSAAGRGRW